MQWLFLERLCGTFRDYKWASWISILTFILAVNYFFLFNLLQNSSCCFALESCYIFFKLLQLLYKSLPFYSPPPHHIFLHVCVGAAFLRHSSMTTSSELVWDVIFYVCKILSCIYKLCTSHGESMTSPLSLQCFLQIPFLYFPLDWETCASPSQ